MATITTQHVHTVTSIQWRRITQRENTNATASAILMTTNASGNLKYATEGSLFVHPGDWVTWVPRPQL